MTYQDAFDKLNKHKHLVGKLLDPLTSDSSLITHIIVASYENLAKVIADVVGNGTPNEAALFRAGFSDDLEVFLLAYSQRFPAILHTTVDDYQGKYSNMTD